MRHAAVRLAGLAVAVTVAACGAGGPTPPTRPSPTGPSPSAPVPPPTAVTAPSATEAGERIEVAVEGGQVRGPGTVRVPLDSEVTLVVSSDVADEVHVHGYDLTEQLAAGGTATITFVADTPGAFEVELEERGVKLLELQVG